MTIFQKSVKTVVKKFELFFFFGVVVAILLYLYANIYDIVAVFLSGDEAMGSGAATYTFGNFTVNLLTMVIRFDPIGMFLKLAGGIIFLGGILALGFSGYFYKLTHAMDSYQKGIRVFFLGIQKHFLRMWITNASILGISLILLILSWLGSIPAIMITGYGMGTADQTYTILGYSVGVLTAVVLFFMFMYALIYFSFSFPGVFMNEAKPFKAGNKVLDRFFWPVFLRFCIMVLTVIVFILFISILQRWIGGPTGWQVISLLWLFFTIFFTVTNSYVFNLFRYLRSLLVKDFDRIDWRDDEE